MNTYKSNILKGLIQSLMCLHQNIPLFLTNTIRFKYSPLFNAYDAYVNWLCISAVCNGTHILLISSCESISILKCYGASM